VPVAGRPAPPDAGEAPGAAPGPGPAHGHRGPPRGVLRRHPLVVLLGGLVVLVVAVLGALAAWVAVEAAGSTSGPRTVVTVRPGQSLDAVVGTLSAQRVVGSGLAFHLYLVVHGSPVVAPGSYLLHRGEDFAAVRATLAGGPDVFVVDVLPGFTVREVAARVGQVPGLDGTRFGSLVATGAVRSPYEPPGTDNLDGLLGTGSYTVEPGETERALLVQMVDRFDRLAGQVGLARGAAALGVSPYQAVTVASIVEKEGVYQQNLGKVARVVYNRLARGMRLQMDSTVLYAEGRDGGTVTAGDLELDTPYNTYRYPGLTPTPIAFPTPAALRAALAPTPGSWLYFVVVAKDGTEAFADTLAGQEANEALAQRRGVP